MICDFTLLVYLGEFTLGKFYKTLLQVENRSTQHEVFNGSDLANVEIVIVGFL